MGSSRATGMKKDICEQQANNLASKIWKISTFIGLMMPSRKKVRNMGNSRVAIKYFIPILKSIWKQVPIYLYRSS